MNKILTAALLTSSFFLVASGRTGGLRKVVCPVDPPVAGAKGRPVFVPRNCNKYYPLAESEKEIIVNTSLDYMGISANVSGDVKDKAVALAEKMSQANIALRQGYVAACLQQVSDPCSESNAERVAASLDKLRDLSGQLLEQSRELKVAAQAGDSARLSQLEPRVGSIKTSIVEPTPPKNKGADDLVEPPIPPPSPAFFGTWDAHFEHHSEEACTSPSSFHRKLEIAATTVPEVADVRLVSDNGVFVLRAQRAGSEWTVTSGSNSGDWRQGLLHVGADGVLSGTMRLFQSSLLSDCSETFRVTGQRSNAN